MTCARLRDAVLVITHWNSSDGNLTNECNDEAKDGVCDASNSNTLKCTCNSSDDAYHFNKTLEQFIFAIPLYESSAGGNITGTYKFTLKHADIWHINYLHIALGAGAIVTFVVIVGGALGRQKMIARRKRKMQALRSCGRSFFIVGAPSTTPRARRKGDNAVTKVPRASPSADSPSGTWSEERDVHTLGSYGVPNTLFHEQSRYDGSHLYTHQTSNKLSRIQTPNIIHSRGRPVGTYFPQADHRAPSRLGSYLAHYFTRLSTVIHLLFNIYGVVENLPRERAGLFNPETQAVACTAPYAHLQEAEFEDHNPHYERIPEGSEHGSVRDEMSLFRLDERRQQRTIFSESKSVHSYYSVY